MDVFVRLREAIQSRKRPRYQQVGFEGVGTVWKDKTSTRVKSVLLGVGTLAVLGYLLLVSRNLVSTDSSYQENSVQTTNAPPGYLHFLIAAPHSDLNFCKALLSAATLGYPTAGLVGWGETLEHPDAAVDIPAINEVKQVHNKLDRKADDDIVMIVNGYTSWLQLRPQTVLDRYFEINRLANERLRKQLGDQAVSDYNLTQKIIFSAQKTCSWTSGDPACYAIPPSTLSDDIYGSKTDVATSDDHSLVRPRFLNAGVVVGTAKEMRALYREARHRMEKDPTLSSPQRALSQIFGEQEVYRELIRRQQPKTWGKSFVGLFSTDPREELFNPEHLEMVASRANATEFGIGLDYESAIGFATESSTNDVAWLTAHDPFQMDRASVKTIQSDITSSLPPFYTYTEEGLDRRMGWESVPLLTNVRTGVAPAVIQHTGDKSLRETWWNKIWFFEHARTLYNAHIYTPAGPLAVAGNGTSRAWWSPEDWRGGARNSTRSWFRYDDICAGTEDEVFRDGRGRWILTQDH